VRLIGDCTRALFRFPALAVRCKPALEVRANLAPDPAAPPLAVRLIGDCTRALFRFPALAVRCKPALEVRAKLASDVAHASTVVMTAPSTIGLETVLSLRSGDLARATGDDGEFGDLQ
jgi:hypothetical protein